MTHQVPVAGLARAARWRRSSELRRVMFGGPCIAGADMLAWPRLLVALATLATLFAAGCQRTSAPAADRLPGRSRPLLTHDWKHPRDFRFATVSFRPPDPGELIRTSSGVKGLVLSNPAETLVRVTAAMPLGRLFESAGEAGTAGYIAQLLGNPAGWLAGQPLAARLASIGAQVRVEQWLDATRCSIEVLDEDWREGLSTLVDLLRGLRIDPKAVAAYRTGPGYNAVVAGVEGAGFRPAVELQRIRTGYPLAPPDPGLSLSPSRLQAVITRALSPAVVVIGIAGNVSRDEAAAALEETTRGWPSGQNDLSPATVVSRPAAARIETVDAPILEGWIAIGRHIDAVPPREQAAVAVMSDLLSARLNVAAREIRGLANRDIFLLPDELDRGGLMHIRTGGRPEAVAPLVKLGLDEVRRLRAPDDRISAEELERAKGALVFGKWQASLDGVRAAGDAYVLEWLRRDSLERLLQWPAAVGAVGAGEVKAAATRYLDPAQMVTVVVGPMAKIRAARHPRWPASLDDIIGK
jgi:predicted Zn-dependent peptidase